MRMLSVKELEAASNAYLLLALATSYPSRELGAAFMKGEVLNDMEDALSAFGIQDNFVEKTRAACCADLSEESCDEGLASLKQDYTRLFAHPKKPVAVPYEALFLHAQSGSDAIKPRLFISEAALSALGAYKRAGFARKVEEDNQSPDYMPMELEFVSRLLMRARDEAQAGALPAAERAMELAREFHADHLDKWAERFFALVEEHAHTPWYRSVGAFGRNVVVDMRGTWES